jgi:hypothetical protein
LFIKKNKLFETRFENGINFQQKKAHLKYDEKGLTLNAISIETGKILRNCLDNFNFKHTALNIIVFWQKMLHS